MRKTGLEPVWCVPHAPQTCASASSATSAFVLQDILSLTDDIIPQSGGFDKGKFQIFMKLQYVPVAPYVALCYDADYVDYPCERDEHKHNGNDKRDNILFVKRAYDTVNALDYVKSGNR